MEATERLQRLREAGEVEGLDDVVQRAALHRLLDCRDLLGGGDHDDIDGVTSSPKLVEHGEAGLVGQVEVEDEEVRSPTLNRAKRLLPRMSHPDDLEPRHSLDEPAVNLGDHVVIVDDDRPDHVTECNSGPFAVNFMTLMRGMDTRFTRP